MQRCLRCGGTKKIAPMGGIQIDCNVCKGVGMVMKESLQAGIPLNPISVTCEHIAGETTLPFNCKATEGEFHTINEISENSAKIEQSIVRKKPGRKPGWNKVINPV
jgi:hypothetical protein